MRTIWVGAALVLAGASLGAGGHQPESLEAAALADAQRHFYNARYAEAAELALRLQPAAADAATSLAIAELRNSALHFQIKSALGKQSDRRKALEACAACPELMKAFQTELESGLSAARAALAANPRDDEALFFLGKFNLNFVWLHLGTLGRRTGWDQYWEARRSLDALLKRNPTHARARVARAWIDYIVDTRMPRGTKWLLGGGDRRRALAVVREAAGADSEFFTRVEAEFALWDMLIREKTLSEATIVARRLVVDFPDNPELSTYLTSQR